MEAFCCICSGIVVWIILRAMFSGSKEQKTVETKIVRVVVEPPPMPPRSAHLASAQTPSTPAPEPKVESPRPTKCPSCGAHLGRRTTCEYCGDSQ